MGRNLKIRFDRRERPYDHVIEYEYFPPRTVLQKKLTVGNEQILTASEYGFFKPGNVAFAEHSPAKMKRVRTPYAIAFMEQIFITRTTTD